MVYAVYSLCSALTVTTTAHAQTPDTATTAPYLLAGAPTFDLSISQFREDFNSQNPSLPLNEFRAIDSSPDKANLTRAASKINENLYASTALERGTLKIKSIQITRYSIQARAKAAKAKAQAYMAAVIRTLTPLMTKTQSQKTAVATNGGKTNVITLRQKVHCVTLSRTTAKRG